MMLLRSVKTPNEKKEYPRNLSLNEVKSFYRNKLPVDLSALGYITPSISEGRLFEIFSAFIFTTTSVLRKMFFRLVTSVGQRKNSESP